MRESRVLEGCIRRGTRSVLTMSVPTVQCANCGRPVSPYAQKCVYCGVLRGPRCPECREPLIEGAVRCPHCGAKLSEPAKFGNVLVEPKARKAVEPSQPSATQAHARSRMGPAVAAVVAFLIVAGTVSFFVAKIVVRDRSLSRMRDAILTARQNYLAYAEARDYARAIEECEALLPRVERELPEDTLRREVQADLEKLRAAKAAFDGEARRGAAEAQGYTLLGDVGIRILKRQRGLYQREPCVDVWISVRNVSGRQVSVSPEDFGLGREAGQVLAPEKPTETFHLSAADLDPDKEASGVLPFKVPDAARACLFYKRDKRLELP